MGFKFQIVLADSLYGESGDFIEALNHHQLNLVVAIRSNHGVWMPKGTRVRYTRWKKFDRVFTNRLVRKFATPSGPGFGQR